MDDLMINALVIGAGVYVRGASSIGSPLGALGGGLIECVKKSKINNVFVASSSFSNANSCVQKLNNKLRTESFYSCKLDELNKEFIEENSVKMVFVAVPDDYHYYYLKKFGEMGLHALTVKPFVQTRAEADELVKLYEDKNIVGAVEFHKRYDPANILLRNKLKKSVEKITRVFVDYSQDKSVPLEDFSKWAVRSNVFQYLGVHYIDLIHWLTQASPVDCDVFYSGTTLLEQGVKTHDNIDVVVKWLLNDGSYFNSVHLTSWAENQINYTPSRQRIQILTSHNRYESEQADRGFNVISNCGLNTINPYFCSESQDEFEIRYSGYGIDSILNFVTEVRSKIDRNDFNEHNICTFKDALASVAVIEMVNEKLKCNPMM